MGRQQSVATVFAVPQAVPSASTVHAITPPRPRRWYQFSLRTLLIGMVVVSAGVGLVGIRMQRARRQQAGVLAIEAIGGSAMYRYEEPVWKFPVDVARTWLGDDFFVSVVEVHVDLSRADTTAQQLAIWKAIGDLPQLEKLRVDYPRRYPRSRFNIGPIRRLTKLHTLKIRDARIDGVDLAPLTGMPSLAQLDLSHNEIGDAAWRHLAGVRKLRKLDGSYSFVTDAGVAHLANCPDLRHLVLRRGLITDGGATELTRIKSLETLVLDGTRITDDALAHLAKLESLKSLSVSETAVTDRGLDHLAESRSLRSITAERRNVTKEALQQFKSLRPTK